MCLAIPGKITRIKGNEAVVDYGSQTRIARIEGIEVKIGDYVLVQFCFVVQKVDEKDALESLRAWNQL